MGNSKASFSLGSKYQGVEKGTTPWIVPLILDLSLHAGC